MSPDNIKRINEIKKDAIEEFVKLHKGTNAFRYMQRYRSL